MTQRNPLPANAANPDVGQQRHPWLMIDGLPLYLYEHELIRACQSSKQDLKRIDELLAITLSPNCRDEKGNTPLMAACRAGNTKVAAFLIERGANINATNNNNETALILACGTDTKTNLHLAVIELLLKNHADPNIVAASGESPLIRSCRDRRKNPTKAVKLLLAAGADPEQCNWLGDTPLIVACVNNHRAVVRMLLDKNVEIDAVNQIGETALTYVSRFKSDREDVIYLLLKGGADYEFTDAKGLTALHHYPAISELIEKAKKEIKPSQGQSIHRQFSLYKININREDGDEKHDQVRNTKR